jgi:hypothetical protein
MPEKITTPAILSQRLKVEFHQNILISIPTKSAINPIDKIHPTLVTSTFVVYPTTARVRNKTEVERKIL